MKELKIYVQNVIIYYIKKYNFIIYIYIICAIVKINVNVKKVQRDREVKATSHPGLWVAGPPGPN